MDVKNIKSHRPRKIILLYEGRRIKNINDISLINSIVDAPYPKDNRAHILPADVLDYIFDIAIFGPAYKSILFVCRNLYNTFILKKNIFFEYETTKMFNIMQQEHLLVAESERCKNKKIKIYQKINGRMDISFGKFKNHYRKKLKHLNNVLTDVFQTPITIQCEYPITYFVDLDIIICESDCRVMLNIIDSDENYDGETGPYMEPIIDKNGMEINEIRKIIARILCHLPNIEICGSFYGINDIPLQIRYLEKYINRGIRYCNKKPFYKRLELLKTYDDWGKKMKYSLNYMLK